MKKILTIFLLLICSTSFAYRDSDIDNLNECHWNKKALKNNKINVFCNDLYHLYSPQSVKVSKKKSSIKLGAFNILGSGRFKDYGLITNVIKNYDLIAVSEMRHSTGRKFESNINLSKNPSLNFTNYYHKPGYLKLLLELQKIHTSWSLILSPAGQSQNEELLGFYFRADKVQLQNSEYCKSYNKNLRGKKQLIFAGGYNGPKFKRSIQKVHLNKSYGCFLNINKDENDLFRVPFSARFKMGIGFDFQMLSYHARFQPPIAISGACGFECLEKINSYLDEVFHEEGAFLKTLDHTALRFLKRHLNFLSLKKNENHALHEEYGSVIKFKYSRPKVYSFLIKAKSFLKAKLPETVEKVWENSYKNKITLKEKNYIIENMSKMFSSLDNYKAFKKFILKKGKIYKAFLNDIVNTNFFAEVYKRYKIWISPEKLARFNEISLILNEMEKIAKLENDTDVLLGGDLNLESVKDSYYWNFFKENYKYSDIAVGSLTSISVTTGLRNAYDHFIYDSKNSMEECLPFKVTVIDFVNKKDYWNGFESYFVKSRAEIEKLSKIQNKKNLDLRYVNSKGALLSTDEISIKRKYISCWDKKAYKTLTDVLKNTYECNVLNQFLNGPQWYRLFTELISDHIPIGIKCSKTDDID